MNKEIFHGKWDEVKGLLKQHWGKLTDDDLLQIKGNHEQVYGILEQRYGYAKEEIQKTLDNIIKDKLKHEVD